MIPSKDTVHVDPVGADDVLEATPSSVDLDEVMREMKQQEFSSRFAKTAKKNAIWLKDFVLANKIFLSACILVITTALGGVYAWQTFYPQYLKSQALKLFEEEDYEDALDAIAEYRTFQTGDAEITYASALSNLKLQRFEQALLEIQILSSLDTDIQTDVDFTFYQALTLHKNISESLLLVGRSLEAEPAHLPSILLRALYGTVAQDVADRQVDKEDIQQMLDAGRDGGSQYSDQIRIMLTYIAVNSKELFLPLKANLSLPFVELGGDRDEAGFVHGFDNSYSLAIDGLYDGSEEIDVDVAVRTIMLMALVNLKSAENAGEADEIATRLSADFGADPVNDLGGYLAAVLYATRGDFETASELYRKVRELNPTDPNTLLNMVNARLQVAPEKFQTAVDDYNTVINFDPENLVALNNRGFLNLWYTENINKAKQDFEQAIRIGEEKYIAADYNLGQAYLKNDESQKAISEFSKVIDAQPGFGNALLYRGMANRTAGEFEYAIKDFNDFKLQDAENIMPYVQSAELFGSSAGYKLALNELQTAIQFQPESEKLAMMLADFYLRADQPQNAEQVLASFPDVDEENLESKLISGRLQFAQGDMLQAEFTLKEVYEAYSLQGDDADSDQALRAAVHYLQALQASEKFDEILELTRTLLPNSPDNVDLLRIRAIAFNEQGRSEEALRFAQRAVEIDPLNFELQIVLGDAFSSSGRFQEAIGAFRTAQKIRPAELEALYKMESLLDLLNQTEELKVVREQITRVENEQLLVRESEQVLNAIQSASSGSIGDSVTSEAQIAQLRTSIEEINGKIKDNPDSGVLYYNRGVVELSIEEIRAAIGSMTTAINKEPGNIDFMMGLATANLRANDFKGAVKILDEVISLGEGNFEAVYNRAVAHHNNGDSEAAIVDYTTAIRLNPAFANAYYNRGTIYVGFAEYYRAIEEFTRVVELWPDEVKPYLARAQVYRLVGENDKAENDMQAAQLLRASQEQQQN